MPSIISAGTTTGTALSLTSDTSGELQIRTNNGSTTAMTLTTGGNVGVGTTTPTGKFQITGASGSRALTLNAPTNGPSLTFEAGGTAFADVGSSTAIFGTGSATDFVLGTRSGYPMIFGTSNAERMRIDSAGLVGIGTSSPQRKFEVHGTPASIGGTATGMLISVVNNNTAFNASPTSGMSFFTRFNSSGSNFPSAALQGGKENTTDGNYAGFMSFFTTDGGGGVNERMRIDSSGNVSIGTTSGSYKLNVTSSSIGIQVTTTSSTKSSPAINSLDGAVDLCITAAGGDGFSYLGNFSAHPIVFGTSNTERMRVDTSGNLLIGTTTYNTARINTNSTTACGISMAGPVTVNNGASRNVSCPSNAGLVLISNDNTGSGALFYVSYLSGTCVLLADPSNLYANSVTAGKISLTKVAQSLTVTLTNNGGSNHNFTVAPVFAGS
jgi:hypothetical protein